METFECKGKLEDGTDCPHRVKYIPQKDVPGVAKIETYNDASTEEVVLCCPLGHCLTYVIKKS